MARQDPAGDAPALTGSLARAISWLAAGIAAMIAIAPPLGHFALRFTHEAASVDLEASVIAGDLGELIARRPDFWTMEVLRLTDLMTPTALSGGAAEQRRLTDAAGGVIVEVGHLPDGRLPGPVLRRQVTVFDQGHPVGRLEIARTLQPALTASGRVALLACLLAIASFAALRVLPVRLLRRALDRAAWLATHDPLTGLPNRALFRERLSEALATARRNGSAVAILCLDLDRFKEVNDTLGHAAGDTLLRQVARRLSACLRETDTLSRLGGDEMAVVQTQAYQPRDAEHLATRLLGILAEPFDLDGHQVVISTSIGIALSPGPGADAARLMQEADLALYQAKAEGRAGFRFFEAAMNERLQARKALEADLRAALANGELRLHYQPQVEIGAAGSAARVTGAEALIRWSSPTRGDVRPDQFIPLAEETGLIVPIGEWVLEEACRCAAGWPDPLRVAVNVSAVQFRHPEFLATVRRVLAETGLPGHRLELEITEGTLMTDTDDTLGIMAALRGLGVLFAMDDFGTGYSSLGYLRKFRFDKIKIDRSFVRNLDTDPEAAAIVRAVVGMSQALGVKANAEGVETEGQALMLRAEGCSEVQGFFYGRPMAPAAFLASLPPPGEGEPVAIPAVAA